MSWVWLALREKQRVTVMATEKLRDKVGERVAPFSTDKAQTRGERENTYESISFCWLRQERKMDARSFSLFRSL